MSLLHFQTVTQVPVGHGPSAGNLCAWSEDNVVAICSQKSILMYHVRAMHDGQMVASLESLENGVQFTERKDGLDGATMESMAILTHSNKMCDSVLANIYYNPS